MIGYVQLYYKIVGEKGVYYAYFDEALINQ